MKNLIMVLALGFCCLSSASVLSDMAEALGEREWAQMPANSSLDALQLHYSLFYYDDSAVWDPVNKQVRQVAGGGTCCGDPTYRFLTYDEASNQWSITSTAFSGSGHAYDGNAVNPQTGHHYWAQKDRSEVKVWNGTSWSSLPTIPFKAGTTPSITWLEPLNGLVYMGDRGKLAFYDGSSWATLSTAAVPGIYNNWSQYNPFHKFIWLGNGTSHYKLDGQLNITRFNSTPPFSLKILGSFSSYDPVSGNFIVTNRSGPSWWEFDPIADSWRQITGMKGNLPNVSPVDQGSFQVPISDYGVILYFTHYHNRRQVYLYKHTKQTSTVNSGPGGGVSASTIQVSPNPFSAGTVIRATNNRKPHNRGRAGIRVYDINGKSVLEQNPSPKRLASGVSWNTASLPAGVYFLKVQTGNTILSRKLIRTR